MMPLASWRGQHGSHRDGTVVRPAVGCRDAGLRDIRTGFHKLDVALEEVLARSFPNSGDADRIRQTFAEDIGVDHLGVGAHRRDGAIHFAFPIVVIVGRKG